MLEVGVESSSASRKSAVAMAVYVMVRDRPGGAPSIWACGFHVGWMDGMGWDGWMGHSVDGEGWDGTGMEPGRETGSNASQCLRQLLSRSIGWMGRRRR